VDARTGAQGVIMKKHVIILFIIPIVFLFACSQPNNSTGNQINSPTEQNPNTPTEEQPNTPAEETPDTPTEEQPNTPAEETPDTPTEEQPNTPAEPQIPIKKIIKRTHYKQINADGSEGTEFTFTYDEKGNYTSQYLVYHQFDNIEPTTRTFVNEYDENGFFVKQITYNGDIITQIDIYENNSNGIPTKKTTSYSNSNSSISSYNEKGLIVEVKSYNNGELVSTLVYEYDNYGNSTKSTSTDKNGNIGINAYEYKDGHSYELIKYWYSYNGETSTYKEYTNVYQLDNYGNLLHLERTDQTGAKDINDAEYY
jgi:hypothetical protein